MLNNKSISKYIYIVYNDRDNVRDNFTRVHHQEQANEISGNKFQYY